MLGQRLCLLVGFKGFLSETLPPGTVKHRSSVKPAVLPHRIVTFSTSIPKKHLTARSLCVILKIVDYATIWDVHYWDQRFGLSRCTFYA